MSLQIKVNVLKEILDKTLKSDKQRKYANSILDTLVKQINYHENVIKILREKLQGDATEYRNELEKAVDILLALGLTQPEFNQLRRPALGLIIKEARKFKRELTVTDLRKINNMYNSFVIEFDKEPDSLEILRKKEDAKS